MQKILHTVLFLTLGLTAALAQREIGTVEISSDNKTVPVRVSASTPELNSLAIQAFSAHGRYRVVASGFTYDIKFTQVAATQVRVDISRSSGTPVDSAVATGSSARNALLRAADIAVEKTNGMGLKGFFTAKLAFIGERTGHKEIYVSDLFLGEVKQITRDNAQALGPRWAPDGSKLLYTSFYKSGFPDIFQIDLNSYQRTTFVSFKGTNSGARYSPNGQQVAMVLSGEGNAEIYVSDAQGRRVSRRTRTDSVEASPSFSPDSSRIVFTSDAAGGPQLYIIPAAGGSMQRVPTNISGYCTEPDWCRANPNKIAFTMRIGRGYQIAVHDFTKGKSEQVSHAPFDGVEPTWLADGRHVVYTARDRSTSRLCILDTESGKSVPVSPASFGTAMQANAWTP
ncbi:MAG: PD40 domain-containing protein [Opitutaceae bacterium]|nr:PD40 domain-containing protein [Opitutaceae bacterium]MBP9913439.1 PD40 domain-containing protein [Opitutaceae bacterium]